MHVCNSFPKQSVGTALLALSGKGPQGWHKNELSMLEAPMPAAPRPGKLGTLSGVGVSLSSSGGLFL